MQVILTFEKWWLLENKFFADLFKGYIQLLKTKPHCDQIKMLNIYLPLFNSASQNTQLKQDYLLLINHLLSNSIMLELNLMDCYELAVISYIHTLFSDSEKTLIKKWKNNFERNSLIINRLRFDLTNEYSYNLNDRKVFQKLKPDTKKSKSLIEIK